MANATIDSNNSFLFVFLSILKSFKRKIEIEKYLDDLWSHLTPGSFDCDPADTLVSHL